jgi:type IV secretory pathway VirB9-like protein
VRKERNVMRVLRLVIAAALVAAHVSAVDAQSNGVREVSGSDRNLIPLTTKLRYTTMILLPDQEEILDVVCGDRDYWVISATQNIAHVKPAKEGAATNLNLVTASGTVYSFLLTEQKNGTTDLKVYVTADPSAPTGARKYFSAADVNALNAELTAAKTAIDAASRRADETIAAFRQQYPTALQFPYGISKYERPFFVRSVWHDGQFTYIKAEARELPALYELKDGEPALVNFQVRNGTYVVPKVIEHGYLALGKDKFEFQQGR